MTNAGDKLKIQEAVDRLIKEEETVFNWTDKKTASRFVPARILDTIPTGAKVCYIHGGELADAILYNDFKGGVNIWINGEWKWYRDEEKAYDDFLDKDHWAQ